MEMNHKERNSSIEIVRIISMVMIIMSHYSFHGNELLYSDIMPVYNYLFLKTIRIGSLGVDLFILLFGYFSTNIDSVNIKRGLRLWTQVWIYSVSICIVLVIIKQYPYSLGNYLKSFFPASFSLYWFFTAYIVLYLLSPYINRIFIGLDKKLFQHMIATMLIVWCLIPTIIQQIPAGNSFTLFFMLYSIGAYIRIHKMEVISKSTGIIGIVLFTGALLISSFVIFFISKKIPILIGREDFFYKQYSVLFICLAISIFVTAINCKPRYNKAINYIASCTFGIYLLHDNEFIRSIIWNDLLRCPEYTNSSFLIVHCFTSVIAIFAVGVVVESIRKFLIEKPFFMVVDKCIDNKPWCQAP